MLACPACGATSPAAFGFCGRCGASLAATTGASPDPMRDERKVITVLFCDLVGFTAASEHADPEDVRATLRPFHAMLRREIERHGGKLEKFIGDAAMAVYGAPVAHEDDAERAVRTALAIVAAGDELKRTAGIELAVRIGINTGEALVTLDARPELGEAMVAGDVVNTASRLQGVAPVNGVVVGEATHRATSRVVEYLALDPVLVKGKDEPIRIWQATAIRTRPRAEVSGVATTFVGRDAELESLRDLWERTVREPSLQLVTVVAEPGAGKSRLVREFLAGRTTGEPITSRQGRCLPYGDGISFWALGEIVKSEAGILESDGPDAAGAKLRAAVAQLSDEREADWLYGRLAPLVGAPVAEAQAATREEAYAAWGRFLEMLATRGPLAIVIEDLHWADEGLLDFVEHLVAAAAGVPLLLVGTARPELLDRRPNWDSERPTASVLSLSGLSASDIGLLLQTLAPSEAVSAENLDRLTENAGGNPLYAEEFVRMLADRGTSDGDRAGFSAPDTLEALIAARVDTLPSQRKGLLHDAAVIGQTFWASAVAYVGNRDRPTIDDGLAELSRREFVRRAPTSSVADQAEYAFWHALVADVAYRQIPRADRAGKHRAAAEWIERLAGERAEDRAELLAYHYTHAIELYRASRREPDAERLIAPARRWLEIAAERATQLDARKAASLFDRALELSSEADADRARLLRKAAAVRLLSGAVEEAQAGCEEAIRILRQLDGRVELADALLAYFDVLRDRGETARASAAIQEAISLLEPEPPGPVHARAYLAFARDHVKAGRPEALTWAERGLEIAERFELPELVVRAMSARGVARFDSGDPGGVDEIRRALQRGLELGLGSDTAGAYVNLAYATHLFAGARAMLEVVTEGIEFCDRRGLTFHAMWMRNGAAGARLDIGDWDGALGVTQEIAAWERAAGESYINVTAMTQMGVILVERGAVEEARPVVEQLLERSRRAEDPQVLVPALIVAAALAAARGRPSEAAMLLRDADAAQPGGWERVPWLAMAVRTATSIGENELAVRMIEVSEKTDIAHAGLLASARGSVAEAAGDLEEAVSQYEAAVAAWAERDVEHERAHALFGQGRCLMTLGRTAEAAVSLEAARDIFQAVGAESQVREISILLAPFEVRAS